MTISLPDLPADVLVHIYLLVGLDGIRALASTCQFLHQVYRNEAPTLLRHAQGVLSKCRIQPPDPDLPRSIHSAQDSSHLARLVRKEDLWKNLRILDDGKLKTIDVCGGVASCAVDILAQNVFTLGVGAFDYDDVAHCLRRAREYALEEAVRLGNPLEEDDEEGFMPDGLEGGNLTDEGAGSTNSDDEYDALVNDNDAEGDEPGIIEMYSASSESSSNSAVDVSPGQSNVVDDEEDEGVDRGPFFIVQNGIADSPTSDPLPDGVMVDLDADDAFDEHEWAGREIHCGMSLRDHDLIAIVHLRQRSLHLLQFSTGQPHPLARKPFVSLAHLLEGIIEQCVSIKICGQRLLIRISSGSFDEAYGTFILVNWYSGNIIAIKQVDMGSITDFEFIQPDMIVYPEDEGGKTNLIRILRLPSMEDDSKELSPESPRARKSFETLLTLCLPKLNRRPDRQSYKTTFYDAVTCIAKPDLRWDSEIPADVGASLKRWGNEAQIVTSPDDAIIRMQYTIAHFYREIRIFTLLVHRSTLVELTKKFPPLMQDNGSNAHAKPQTLRWEEWGPECTHIDFVKVSGREILDAPFNVAGSVFGQRQIICKKDKVILRDFNPYAVQESREIVMAQAGNGDLTAEDANLGEDGGVLVREDPTTGATVRLFDNPRRIVDEYVWKHKSITCGLPFVETVMPRDGLKDHFMALGEDCVYSVHASKNALKKWARLPVPKIDVYEAQ